MNYYVLWLFINFADLSSSFALWANLYVNHLCICKIHEIHKYESVKAIVCSFHSTRRKLSNSSKCNDLIKCFLINSFKNLSTKIYKINKNKANVKRITFIFAIKQCSIALRQNHLRELAVDFLKLICYQQVGKTILWKLL